MTDEISGLAFIEVKDSNPLTLFKEWQQEISDLGALYFQANAFCLATSTKDGKVSNRNVVLKELNENGFVFATDKRGRKAQEIKENPCVAATFLWNYEKDKKIIARQVRIEGKIQEIDCNKLQIIYDAERPYCKIRSAICNQDREIEWGALKKKHDEVLNDVVNNKKDLPMPDHYIGYQIVPEQMDFYYAWNTHIGDRVVFTKTEEGWKFVHVAA